MSLMSWKDEYSVKVRTIDQQHKKLIDLLNQMHDAMKASRGREVVEQVLAELVNYTNTHFAYEETLMKKHGYASYESHKLQHQGLVKKVTDFQRDLKSGRASVTIEVLGFLKEWLNGHILGTDRQYASFFEGKNIQ